MKGTTEARPVNSLVADKKPPKHSASSSSSVFQSREISLPKKDQTEGG